MTTKATKQGSYHHGNLRRATLDAAIQLITEQGVNQLTLRKIARRVGASPMASYRHFKNKAALLVTLAHEGFELLYTDMSQSLVQVPAEPLRRLQATGVAYVRFAFTHSTHFRLMFGPSISNRHDYLELERAERLSFELLVGGLQECQRAKCIRSTDARQLARILWSQVHGLAMLILDEQINATDLAEVERLAELATWTTIEGLKV
ncbi:MAG: TetR/AcrR family transcriptional regulator [Cyanophyceae cyanobacterium]